MSSCVVAVRAATPADLGDIVRLYLVLRDHHHELEPTNARYLVDKTEWELVVKRALEDPRAGVLVATADDRLIGFVKLSLVDKPWGKACEMDTLVVGHEQRGAGVGGRLVNAAERWAAKQGADAMRSNVIATNDRGRAFYEREGYEAFAIRYGKPL
jgi:ribosomal protein S18 acetylase RimI-like enzyme